MLLVSKGKLVLERQGYKGKLDKQGKLVSRVLLGLLVVLRVILVFKERLVHKVRQAVLLGQLVFKVLKVSQVFKEQLELVFKVSQASGVLLAFKELRV